MALVRSAESAAGLAEAWLFRGFQQGVRFKTDHFFPKPVVEVLQRFHCWHQFVDGKYARGLLHIAE